MTLLWYLTVVICSCIQVSYVSCRRSAKSRASQPGKNTSKAAARSVSCCAAARQQVFHLSASGLPIRCTSPAIEEACDGQRCQGCLYCQALTESGATAASPCLKHWSYVERSRRARTAEDAWQRARTWLRSGPSALAPSIWNTNLTVCLPISSHRLINFSFRISSGPPVAPRR